MQAKLATTALPCVRELSRQELVDCAKSARTHRELNLRLHATEAASIVHASRPLVFGDLGIGAQKSRPYHIPLRGAVCLDRIRGRAVLRPIDRSEEHTSELQSRQYLV